MPRQKRKVAPEALKEKEERFKAAIAAVHDGMSIRNSAKEYGIPYSTLQDHCSGRIKISWMGNLNIHAFHRKSK